MEYSRNNLFVYTLRLADDALILGHRLGEMCGKGPILEEDLALTNIALDLIGRSESLYRHAAKTEGKGHSEDDLAYRRAERSFYNHLLCEQANTDFAHIILRQLFVSQFENKLYSELSKSSDAEIAAIAGKSVKEIRYHLRHASDWCLRLGTGTDESHDRMQSALDNLWMFTGELFETDAVDEWAIHTGTGPDIRLFHGQWKTSVIDLLTECGLKIPDSSYMQTGSKKGIHTEQLGYILADMQYLQRAYPDAEW